MDIPLNNLTALNNEVVRHWVSSPKERGTSDILYTCVATIILCVYTAVHINIPPPGERPIWQWLRKAKWTVTGILAPELVLFAACAQFLTARHLVSFLNEKDSLQKDEAAKNIGRSSLYMSLLGEYSDAYKSLFGADQSLGKSFDIKYGFYAVMGGFRVNMESIDPELKSVCIPPQTIKLLAKEGVFLRVNPETIADRSKANNVAKTLVCVQISWMLVECVTRKVYGLPLALLEIHTFVHVICAAMMYMFWFQKPFDISEATFVDLNANAMDHIALIYLAQGRSRGCYAFKDPKSQNFWFRLDDRKICRALCSKSDGHPYIQPDILSHFPSATLLPAGHYSWETEITRPRFEKPSGFGDESLELIVLGTHYQPDDEDYEAVDCVLSLEQEAPAVVKTYRMAAKAAATRNGGLGAPLSITYDNLDLLNQRARNINRELENIPNTQDKFVVAIAIFVLTTYGAIHSAAWNSKFPNDIEMWLWRSCALLVTVWPWLATAWGIYLDSKKRLNYPNNNARRIWHRWAKRTVDWVQLSITIIARAIYVFARIFIVLESFISLRAVPIGVYASIPWSNFIPHI